MKTKRFFAEGFGKISGLYDRKRPSYPQKMIRDIIIKSKIGKKSRVLEIGAGTGIATELFASKGLSITAVEPLSKMAELAKRRTKKLKVEYIIKKFEDLKIPEQKYDMIYAAQAFHWIDKRVREKRAAAFLKQGGFLVLFWNILDKERSELVRKEYLLRKRKGKSKLNEFKRDYKNQIKKLKRYFTKVATMNYRWNMTYNTEDYLSLACTKSWVIAMSAKKKESYVSELRRIIEKRENVKIPYITQVTLAMK